MQNTPADEGPGVFWCSVQGGGHHAEEGRTRRGETCTEVLCEGDVDNALAAGVDGLTDDDRVTGGGGGLAVCCCGDSGTRCDGAGGCDSDDSGASQDVGQLACLAGAAGDTEDAAAGGGVPDGDVAGGARSGDLDEAGGLKVGGGVRGDVRAGAYSWGVVPMVVVLSGGRGQPARPVRRRIA
ncbi:hypothetical protein P9209_03395 [Prescottella defluvii]|nr:hypothetical protein P9209_03395 [Prescottella defluvii]